MPCGGAPSFCAVRVIPALYASFLPCTCHSCAEPALDVIGGRNPSPTLSPLQARPRRWIPAFARMTYRMSCLHLARLSCSCASFLPCTCHSCGACPRPDRGAGIHPQIPAFARMTVTAGMSAKAQMLENAWTRAQICLKTVAFTKNGEFTQHLPNSPNELFWCEKQLGH